MLVFLLKNYDHREKHFNNLLSGFSKAKSEYSPRRKSVHWKNHFVFGVYLFLFIYNHGITVKGTTHNSAKITLKLKSIFKSMGISKQDM